MEEKQNGSSPHLGRPIDRITQRTRDTFANAVVLVKKTRLRTWQGALMALFVAGLTAATAATVYFKIQSESKAAAPSFLSLTPATATVTMGTPVILDIMLNTQTNPVVAAQAVITYDPALFSLQSWSTANSAFAAGNTCVHNSKPCEIVNHDTTNGKLFLTLAKPSPGVTNTAGLMAKLTFQTLKATTPTSPNIRFDYTADGQASDSAVVLADGTDTLTTVSGAQITVTPPPDTTPPTTSITAPAAGVTVNGTAVTVSTNASDNVGVSGVQFKLDGNNLGSEDTTSPYSTVWNTTSATNGSHALTATARDAAANTTTSTGVNVTVNNAPSICAPTSLTLSSATSDSGSAYIVLKTFGIPADTTSFLTRSSLRVFENGTELTPAHSSHANIRNLGAGRFSHWSSTDGTGESLRFSASNNSDPRSNGRNYTYTTGCTPSPANAISLSVPAGPNLPATGTTSVVMNFVSGMPTSVTLARGATTNFAQWPTGNLSQYFTQTPTGLTFAFCLEPSCVPSGPLTLTVTGTYPGGQTATASVNVAIGASPLVSGGPVAAYNFNEGSGTTLTDRSSTGNPGTLSGPVWNTTGKYGGSLTFDGVNDWVTINDSNSLDLTNGMTLEAWVYPTAWNGHGGWETIFIKEMPASRAYGMYANSDRSQPTGHIYSGVDRILYGTVKLSLNTWTHVATTYNGSIQRLYVNGQQVSSRAQTGSIATSANPLRIGGNTVWGQYFNGRIDDIRIYNTARTATQIQTDMNTPIN